MSIFISSFYDNHQIYNTIQKIISIIMIILFSVPYIYDKKIFDYCKPKRKAYMS